MSYRIAETSALVAGLSASILSFFSEGIVTSILKISALPAGIINHSGTSFTSANLLDKTSFALNVLICSVVNALTATEIDSARVTVSSGLKGSPCGGQETKSKYKAFCIAS